VCIDGRHSCDSGDHNPPTVVCDSNTRTDNPASMAAFAEASPDGPAPKAIRQIEGIETYDGDGLGRHRRPSVRLMAF